MHSPRMPFRLGFLAFACAGLAAVVTRLWCDEQELSLVVMHRLLDVRSASLVVEHGLSCSTACGILVPQPRDLTHGTHVSALLAGDNQCA